MRAKEVTMIHAELTSTDDVLIHQMLKGLMSPIIAAPKMTIGMSIWEATHGEISRNGFLPVIYYILISFFPIS
jgi:hypothetical protein